MPYLIKITVSRLQFWILHNTDGVYLETVSNVHEVHILSFYKITRFYILPSGLNTLTGSLSYWPGLCRTGSPAGSHHTAGRWAHCPDKRCCKRTERPEGSPLHPKPPAESHLYYWGNHGQSKTHKVVHESLQFIDKEFSLKENYGHFQHLALLFPTAISKKKDKKIENAELQLKLKRNQSLLAAIC